MIEIWRDDDGKHPSLVIAERISFSYRAQRGWFGWGSAPVEGGGRAHFFHLFGVGIGWWTGIPADAP